MPDSVRSPELHPKNLYISTPPVDDRSSLGPSSTARTTTFILYILSTFPFQVTLSPVYTNHGLSASIPAFHKENKNAFPGFRSCHPGFRRLGSRGPSAHPGCPSPRRRFH